MIDLVQAERQKYLDMWSFDGYSNQSPGEYYMPVFLDMLRHAGLDVGGTVLDAGAGAGRGAIALRDNGFSVTLCDVADVRTPHVQEHFQFYELPLWANLKATIDARDYVFCCDVLEHVPPAFTMLVIQRLLDVSRRAVFLSIAFLPDEFGVWIGETLHQTVMPFTWWRDNLAVLGCVLESRDLMNSGAFLVTKR